MSTHSVAVATVSLSFVRLRPTPAAAMITVSLHANGRVKVASFLRLVTLRDVQRELCAMYDQRFPSIMATLELGGRHYDSFDHRPFVDCTDGAMAEVYFGPTDDPYFYDLADRCGPKFTLQDEVAWEDAVSSGNAMLDLAEWVASRRNETAPAVLAQLDATRVRAEGRSSENGERAAE